MATMPVITEEEDLRQRYSNLNEVARFYAEVGLGDDAIYWAGSELGGDRDTVALALFRHSLALEVMAANDTSWPDSVLAGDPEVYDRQLRSEASEAVRRLQELGVDLTLLTPVIRAFQARSITRFVALLAGSNHCPVQPPPGRETDWALFVVDAEWDPIANISDLSDLHPHR
jgi:hypothetical protein